MTIEVEGPDGVVVEFPDGTPRETIGAAMRRKFGGPAKTAAERAIAGGETSAMAPSFFERFGQGVMDPLVGTRQLVANVDKRLGLTDRVLQMMPSLRNVGIKQNADDLNRYATEREAGYQARREGAGETGIDWARMGGNIVGTLPLAALAPAPASIGGAVGIGMGTGAAGSAAMPIENATDEDFFTRKGKQALTGATIGAVTGPAAYGAGRLLSPKINDPVKQLAGEGVEMTPGQILGGGYKTAEDALTSLPIIGDQIRTAQTRSLETFNRAAANRALFPIGKNVPKDVPAGREMFAAASKAISQAYDDLLPNMRLVPDQKFQQDIAATLGGQKLVPSMQQKLIDEIQDKVAGRLQGQTQLTGETFKKIEAELGQLAGRYGKSSVASEQELGAAFGQVQQVFRDLLLRSNPWAADKLKAINIAYANLVRVRGASAAQGATEGVFTPAQLSGAVRASDKSVGKGAFARGDALMQDLSDAGKAVLPSSVPDSGTPRRAMQAAAVLAAGGGTGMVNPALAAGGIGMLGAYTNPAQRALQWLLLKERPELLRMTGNALAAGGPGVLPLAASRRE